MALHHATKDWLLVLGLCLGGAAAAQVPCDSLHQVSFGYEPIGGYTFTFTPGANIAGAPVWYAEWGVAGEGVLDYSYDQQPQYTFPGPADYLVCLNATVQDDQQGYCLSTSCQLVSVPVDSLCAGLVAAFTIEPQGGAIHFVDQSQSGTPITAWAWDFGDGTNSTEASPTHQYGGPGPFQACLTVTTATCTATVCNWTYLGPPDVPCDTLLHADIGLLQIGYSVAAFNQSILSGMNASVAWDFGDGTSDSGSTVIHTYASEGYYALCATVSLWGPLTPDTCTATVCQDVSIQMATGVGPVFAAQTLRAKPNPFTDGITVEGVQAPATWQLVDALGAVRRSGTVVQRGALVLSGASLAPGPYLLRVVSAGGASVLRLVKVRE